MNNNIQIFILVIILFLEILLLAIILSGCNIPAEFIEEEAIKVEEDLYKEQKNNGNQTSQTQIKKTVNTKQVKK